MEKSKESNSDLIVVKMEINPSFFVHLKEVMGNGRELAPIEHIRNALELYANVIEGIADGKTPALVDPASLTADKLPLSEILALLKHEKELENNKTIDLKRGFL